MPSVDQDYLMRAIQQLAEALRQILKLRKLGLLQEALAEIFATNQSLVGLDAQLFDLLDSAALVRQLGAERLEIAALLIAEEAEVRQALGDFPRSFALRRRALEFLLETRATGAALGRASLVAVRDLLEYTGSDQLSDRLRDVLEGLRPQIPPHPR
jgi:hypothetical protein